MARLATAPPPTASPLLLLLLPLLLLAAAGNRAAAAPPNVCGANSTLGAAVVSVLNLDYPGLEAVAAAVAAGDLNTACDELATYYANANTSYWLRLAAPPPPGTGRVGPTSYVDLAVDKDYYFMAGVDTWGTIPRNADGMYSQTEPEPRPYFPPPAHLASPTRPARTIKKPSQAATSGPTRARVTTWSL